MAVVRLKMQFSCSTKVGGSIILGHPSSIINASRQVDKQAEDNRKRNGSNGWKRFKYCSKMQDKRWHQSKTGEGHALKAESTGSCRHDQVIMSLLDEGWRGCWLLELAIDGTGTCGRP